MEKKYTLITGATSGIGYELAKIFAENKNNLILLARSEDKLLDLKERLRSTYNIDIEVIKCDLSNEEEVEKAYEYINSKNLIVDNLVNNAGMGSFGDFSLVNKNKDLQMIDVNIRALTHLTKLFIQDFIKRGEGGILNLASTAAFSPGPYMSVYYSTKAYVISLTEALREEVKDKNIRISALCPGPTDTEFQSRAEVKKAEFSKSKLMTAKEVAIIGYKGFIRGKTIIIPGINNKILISCSKVLPRKLLSKVIAKVNGK